MPAAMDESSGATTDYTVKYEIAGGYPYLKRCLKMVYLEIHLFPVKCLLLSLAW